MLDVKMRHELPQGEFALLSTFRVFDDVTKDTVEVLAVVPKSEANQLEKHPRFLKSIEHARTSYRFPNKWTRRRVELTVRIAPLQ